MDHRSHRFYDIRFGILIGIILSILLFKYFNAQTVRPQSPAPAPAASFAPASQSDTIR